MTMPVSSAPMDSTAAGLGLHPLGRPMLVRCVATKQSEAMRLKPCTTMVAFVTQTEPAYADFANSISETLLSPSVSKRAIDMSTCMRSSPPITMIERENARRLFISRSKTGMYSMRRSIGLRKLKISIPNMRVSQ